MSATSFFTLDDPRICSQTLQEIMEEVAGVEQELGRQVSSQVNLVAEVCSHVLSSGGKRLRPAFVTLSARATGLPFDPERARKLGACMEMIHMATLIHDDVIDHASTRRGRQTANEVYGNTASILSGDVLLSKAMVLLAEDGDLEIIRLVSSAVVELAEGEVRELETRNVFDLDAKEHFEILRMKTASFIQCCCEVGALVADASNEVRQALGLYGHHIGMAFQIVDDLLDYRGDNAKTGKPVATDFREGCATLPLIFLKEHLNEDEVDLARRKFGNGVTEEEIRMICDWMLHRGAFQTAELAAFRQVELAVENLRKLSQSADRDLLEAVGSFVLSRQA